MAPLLGVHSDLMDSVAAALGNYLGAEAIGSGPGASCFRELPWRGGDWLRTEHDARPTE
jgi:hypothetical protein